MEIIHLKNRRILYSEIKRVVDILRDGGLAILPTDTVYGLGGLAGSRSATDKIFRLKKREKAKPLIFFISDKKYLKKLGVYTGLREKKLIDYFWPGAVTFIFRKTGSSEKDKKIAVRIPGNLFVLKILKRINEPLAVTSANISGEKAPVDFCRIKKSILENVDIAVDAGKCFLKKASTIIDVSGQEIKILRKGTVSRREIMRILEGSQKSKVKSQN